MKKLLFLVLLVFTVLLFSSYDGFNGINVQASPSYDLNVLVPDCDPNNFVGICEVPSGEPPTYPPQSPGGVSSSDFKIRSWSYIPY